MDLNDDLFIQVTGLIHLSEKYLIDTLRHQCKKFVYNWLHEMELIHLDEKKDLIPRHILYKDGTRKHIAAEIGNVQCKTSQTMNSISTRK